MRTWRREVMTLPSTGIEKLADRSIGLLGQRRTRLQLRVLSLAPATKLSEFVVVPQWFNFSLWVVLLLAGLATVGYMVRRVLTSPATGADAA